ncbi:hypothetical protein [Flavobacterium filum]|uniref:hypothetical protein n=1 Tax=Flavobacterium filum TaxID=370974 RepID=UPI0023F122DD|nr:hypothetical protein [Flavobacterium filum]
MNISNFSIHPMILPQALLDDATASSNVVDLAGSKYCYIAVQLGATDIAVAALKVQEADAKTDATTLTSGADITGLTYATALPSATDDNKTYLFAFPTEGRKRYVNVVATAGNGSTGTYLTATAILFDKLVHNDNAASFNVAGLKRIP